MLDEQQMARYEHYRRAKFPKAPMRRLVSSLCPGVTQCEVTTPPPLPILLPEDRQQLSAEEIRQCH